MEKISDNLIIIVVLAAFAVGYWVVSFILKKVKQLNELPKMNEESWKQQARSEAAKNRDQASETPPE